MLRVNNLTGFGRRRVGAGGVAGTPADNLTEASSYYTSSGASSFTDPGVDIGTAADSRVVYVAAMYSQGNSATPTCTVGGTSLAIAVSDVGNGGQDHSIVIFAGVIDASHGGSADVVVSQSGSPSWMAFATLVSWNNTNGATATDTASSTNSNTISGLVVDAGGVGLAVFYSNREVTSQSGVSNGVVVMTQGDSASGGGTILKMMGAQTGDIDCTNSPTNDEYNIAAAFK